jgi:hypothetical protein
MSARRWLLVLTLATAGLLVALTGVALLTAR